MQERSLGCWESGFRSAHDMLAGTMLVVGCADIVAQYDFEKITTAFEILFNRHPLLQAIIEVRGFNSFFVMKAQFSNIPIAEVLNQEEEWEKQFDAEIHDPLDSSKYLWRIRLMRTEWGYKLFLITHHAIADALSQVNLLEQFLSIYNTLIQNIAVEVDELPLLGNIEKHLKTPLSWEAFSDNYDVIAQADIDKIDYEAPAIIQERHSASKFFQIDSEQLQKLLKDCKQHEVTLNSLLNAVMLKTQMLLSPSLQKACLKTPVNLRQHCEPPIEEKHVGCYLSIVETLHELSNQDVWQLAAEYQKQLHEAIPLLGFLPREIDYNEVDIALVTKLFAVGSARRRKHLPNTFGVSNIGRLNIKTQFDKGALKDFVFNTNHLVGNYYMFLSALTLNNHLNLTFAYVTPLISEASADKFISAYLELLGLL